ncbi:MAG: MFS transporter [Candidatus Hermodarchaeota archaeon]
MSTAFRNMGMSIVQVGLPSFNTSLGGDWTTYGIIVGIFSVTQCFLQYPFAAISDKLGRRRVVLFGMIVYLVGTFLCFTSQNIIQLIIYRAIQGAGAYTSILQAVIGDIYKKDQHSKGMGYHVLSMNVGYFLGFVVGGLVSDILGFESIFLVQGFLICFSFIIMVIFLKDSKTTETRQDNNGNLDFNLASIKILLKKTQYILALIFNCVRWFIFGFITTYLILVLQDPFQGFNLSETISSYLLLGILALYVLFVYIASKLIHRYRSRKISMIGLIIVLGFGIFFFFPTLVLNLPIFLVIISFIGIGIAFIDPAGNTLLLEVIEDIQPELKGSGIGFNNAIGFFCSAIAPMIMTPLGGIYIILPFYVILILMIVCLIILQFKVDKKY